MKSFSIIIIIILLLLCQVANTYIYSLDRHSIELEDKVLSYVSAIDSLYIWISQLNIDEKFLTPEQLYSILNNKTFVLKIMEKMYEDPIVAIFTGGAVVRILKLYGIGNPYINEEDIIKMIKTIALRIDEHDKFFNNSKIMTKFINNLFESNVANYTISDIKEYSELILKLGIERNISQTILSEITMRLLILAQSMKSGYIKKDTLNLIIDDTSFKYSIITALFINDVIDKNNIRIINSDDSIQLHKIVVEVQDIDISKLYKMVDLAIAQLKKSSNEDIYTYYSLDIEIYDIINQLLEGVNITNSDFNTIVNESTNLSNKSQVNPIQDLYGSQDSRNYIDRIVSLEHSIYYYIDYYENDNIRSSSVDNNSKDLSSSKVNKSNSTLSKQINLSRPKSSSIQTIVKQVNSYDITLRRASNISIDREKSIIISLANYRISLPNVSTSLVISIILSLIPLLIILIHFKFFLKGKQSIARTTSTLHKYYSSLRSEDPWLRVFIEFWNIIDRISKVFNINIELCDTHREVQRKILNKINADVNRNAMLNETIRYYEIARFSQLRGGMDIDLFKSRIELLKRYLIDINMGSQYDDK